VLIADEHRLFAESLMGSLSVDDRVDIVGIACAGEELLELVEELQPDVVLMDIGIPRLSDVEATRMIHEDNPRTRVLILTGDDEELGPSELAALGAAGWLSKRRSFDDFLSAFFEFAAPTVPRLVAVPRG
jgi:DNA-binding NarL/FixJ family response regulator